MQMIKGSWMFYKKLIVPSAAISILLGAISYVSTTGSITAGIGIAYIFLTPLFHFIIYEINNPKEYYFYYNLGLNKIALWANTLVMSLITGLILILI